MFCLLVDNCWFVLEERICFKKTFVRCGKVAFLWSNSAAVGGQFVYVLSVFRISSLISFAANFTKSSWLGILLTLNLNDFLLKLLKFLDVTYDDFTFWLAFLVKELFSIGWFIERIFFSNSLSIFSRIGLASVTASSSNGKLLL